MLGHRPALDGLRGLAVLAVMAYHCGPGGFLRGGFLGVDVFFVLSGFLITVLLLQEHQRSGSFRLTGFYVRRALRLLPALLAMLGACCVFAAFRTRPDRAREIYQAALLTACYAANWHWLWSARLDLLGHAWSLSQEGQFYLIWPVLLLLLLRIGARPRLVIWFVVLGIATAGVVRAVIWIGPWPAGAQEAAAYLTGRADSLLAGCLVGLLAASNRLPKSPGPRAVLQVLACASSAALLCLGVTADADATYMQLGGFTVAAAAAAVIVAALVHAPPRLVTRVLSAPVLVWVGQISYGLYLWHFPLLSIAPKLVHGICPAAREIRRLDGALAIALAFAAAALSYYWVERPFLRLKSGLAHAENVPASRYATVAVVNRTR